MDPFVNREFLSKFTLFYWEATQKTLLYDTGEFDFIIKQKRKNESKGYTSLDRADGYKAINCAL